MIVKIHPRVNYIQLSNEGTVLTYVSILLIENKNWELQNNIFGISAFAS